VNAAKKDDYRFSSLLMGIVQSAPFQMRMSQNVDTEAQAVQVPTKGIAR
jgi:hypothetical protein